MIKTKNNIKTNNKNSNNNNIITSSNKSNNKSSVVITLEIRVVKWWEWWMDVFHKKWKKN